MRFSVAAVAAAVLAITLVSFGGCGVESPLAPSSDSELAFAPAISDNAAPPSAARPATAPAPIRVTKRIGPLGGKVTAGRHTVTFLPGALLRQTDITVVDRTPVTGFVECELFPEGTRFLAPVTLQSNCSDLFSPVGARIYWLDTSNLLWLNIGGVPSPDGKGVIAVLRHFSTYRTGKAGW